MQSTIVRDVRSATSHDAAHFRAVAGRFATGVTVVTTCDDGVPSGMTVNAFATVSLEPLLLLVCLHERSRVLAAIQRSGAFEVTVLAADQRDCAKHFATAGRPVGHDAFAGMATHTDAATGCPVLSDGVAYFGCSVHSRLPGGDHSLVVGAVRSFGVLRPAAPLLFADGRFAEASTVGSSR